MVKVVVVFVVGKLMVEKEMVVFSIQKTNKIKRKSTFDFWELMGLSMGKTFKI